MQGSAYNAAMKVNAADTIIEVGGIKIGPSLTKEQAEKLYELGQETVVFVLTTQAKMIAQQMASSAQSPAAPSSAKPVYKKENKLKKKRRKKIGAKKGHVGSHRAKPVHIDRRQEHSLKSCPHCGNENLSQRTKKRTRIIIDIPEGFNVETVEHTIDRSWCPECKRIVEPKVPEALEKCTFGNRILAFSSWLHYGLGSTLSQIVETFNYHLQTPISEGGLVEMWHRLAKILTPWYEQLKKDALSSAVLHGDETGWRVNGRTQWDNSEAKRLRKRLDKYEDYLFTFLDKPYVPFDNNHAERSIRPAVIMRKNSYTNRSDKGARTQSALMSILRTLKQRNANPISTIAEALRKYIQTGNIPLLPQRNHGT